MECLICGTECDGTLAIGDFRCKDGSDFIVCADCLNDYAEHDFDRLNKKLELNRQYQKDREIIKAFKE